MYHPEGEDTLSSVLPDVSSSSCEPGSLNLSVEVTEPASSTPVSDRNVLPHASFSSRLLVEKQKYPPNLPPSKGESRVLTSAEYVNSIKEKERKKEEAEEKLRRKAERAKERTKREKERNRIALQQEKEQKGVEREQRNLAKRQRGNVRHGCESLLQALKCITLGAMYIHCYSLCIARAYNACTKIHSYMVIYGLINAIPVITAHDLDLTGSPVAPSPLRFSVVARGIYTM